MGNKARSSITVNSSTLGSHGITTLNAADLVVSSFSGTSATISDTLTAGNVITNSVSVILAMGTLNNDTMTVNLNSILPSSSYTQSSIVNPSPNSHVGFICVSLIDNTNLTGSIALYTRGKMWELTVYTVIFEKNTNTDSTVSLNTDSGALTISTSKNITFEIKALNLFEK